MNPQARVISLLTDFGTQMGYVGQMKGVILSINPEAHLVDLSHDVPAQSIATAALVLEQSTPFFPTGSIHLAVTDPGVGTDRPAVVVETEKALFVGPDNGLFGFLAKSQQVRSIHRIVNERYFLDQLSNTFHGRDIFAPIAAYLSLGYPPDEFGPLDDSLCMLSGDGLRKTGNEVEGDILAVDVFGNLITSLPADAVDHYLFEHADRDVYAWCHDQPVPIRFTYADVPEGDLLAYIGSGGRLEIAVNRGNAATKLNAGIGTPVKLITL